MKILVTGATGFLGKKTLFELMNHDSISELLVVSRSKRTHPSPKVKVIQGDLTDPTCLRGINRDIDAIVHIAGLYDFSKPYSDNYLNNVVATSQIIAWAKDLPRKPHFHFISTYAVGAGNWAYHEPELPLKILPPESRYYSYSKALAESTVTTSTLPFTIYRPGIIVGDSVTGQFENLNGPYYILSLLSQLNKMGLLTKMPFIPLPADKNGLLPLVPVDMVAKSIVSGVLRSEEVQGSIYGIYRNGSVTCEDFVESVKAYFKLNFKPIYVGVGHPKLLKIQRFVTQIPEEVFIYATEVHDLPNPRYLVDFPDHVIPVFSEYSKSFYDGFLAMNGDF